MGSVANRNDPPTASWSSSSVVVASLSTTGTLGSIGVSVGDPDGTRTVTAIVALLLVLGLGLIMLTVWLFRMTRPDPEVLAPLETMGERKWRRADPVWQRRRLDAVRPAGAEPLEPSAAPPDLDEAFDLGPTASGFDDLQDAPEQAPDPDGVSIPGDPLVAGIAAPAVDQTAALRRNGSVKIGPLAPPSPPTVPPGLAPGLPPPVEVAPRFGPVDPLIGAASVSEASTTPTGIRRPTTHDLPDRDMDPELLAAAMAELDAEFAPPAPAPADDGAADDE